MLFIILALLLSYVPPKSKPHPTTPSKLPFLAFLFEPPRCPCFFIHSFIFFRHRSLKLSPHSCISARRRRRRNLQPIYGTGWAGRPPWGHGHAQYNPNYQGGYAQPQREPPYVQQPERQDRYAAPGADGAQGYGGYYVSFVSILFCE